MSDLDHSPEFSEPASVPDISDPTKHNLVSWPLLRTQATQTHRSMHRMTMRIILKAQTSTTEDGLMVE
ncbi:unnamed protein product [Linum trigynum]|uniref:Uncharacterized protein n=1 Tax=Linum trigynum TaxID=586398 RepID=A0AAV2DH71_9ROSI